MYSGTSLNDAIRLWPTPDSMAGGGESSERKQALGRSTSGGGDLIVAAEMWPTASARDYKDTPGMSLTGTNPDGSIRTRDDQLARAAHLWATPRAEDAESAGNHPNASDSLTGQTKELWLTPATTDVNGERQPDGKRSTGLNTQVSLFSPQDHETSMRGESSSSDGPTSRQQWLTPHGFANTDETGKIAGGGGEFHKQAMAVGETIWPTPAATPYGSSQNGINGKGGENERPSANTPGLEKMAQATTPEKAKLNPRFVEWLMGLPLGWTDFAPVGTAWSHWQQHTRSSLCVYARSIRSR
jgi:hypothetical protein